jgi:hypothetical protein
MRVPVPGLSPADSELGHWERFVVSSRSRTSNSDGSPPRAALRRRGSRCTEALPRWWNRASHRSSRFGVFLTLKVPSGGAGTPGVELVKSLIDGVVAAFQAHGDRATVEAVATCFGDAMREEPLRIAELLLDQRRAALGVVDHLVRKRGTGVQWNPGDHMCMVGQLLRDQAEGRDWRLSGELWLLEPFAV